LYAYHTKYARLLKRNEKADIFNKTCMPILFSDPPRSRRLLILVNRNTAADASPRHTPPPHTSQVIYDDLPGVHDTSSLYSMPPFYPHFFEPDQARAIAIFD